MIRITHLIVIIMRIEILDIIGIAVEIVHIVVRRMRIRTLENGWHDGSMGHSMGHGLSMLSHGPF